MMNDDLPLPERLRAFGRNPIDPPVQSQHLTAMATTRPPATRRRVAVRLRVAGAVVIGLLVLSTGLAVAEVDAGPITAVGKQLAGVVGVDVKDGTVTHGTVRHYGQECLQIAEGKGARNRGQYLKWVRLNHPDMLEAAKASNCGKPLQSENKDDDHD